MEKYPLSSFSGCHHKSTVVGNRAVRLEFLVLKLERNDIAGLVLFVFLNSSKRSHLEGHLLRILWLFLMMCEKQYCFLWKQLRREEERYKFLYWKSWLCWTKHRICYEWINCLHHLCSHTLHLLFPVGSNTSSVFHPKLDVIPKYQEFARNRTEPC